MSVREGLLAMENGADILKVFPVSYTHLDVYKRQEYGCELLNKLRGMFAFVIWDSTEKKPEMPSVLMQADWLLVVDTVIRPWRVYHSP